MNKAYIELAGVLAKCTFACMTARKQNTPFNKEMHYATVPGPRQAHSYAVGAQHGWPAVSNPGYVVYIMYAISNGVFTHTAHAQHLGSVLKVWIMIMIMEPHSMHTTYIAPPCCTMTVKLLDLPCWLHPVPLIAHQ